MMPSASGRAVSVPRTAFVLRSKITTEPSPSVMNPRPASGARATPWLCFCPGKSVILGVQGDVVHAAVAANVKCVFDRPGTLRGSADAKRERDECDQKASNYSPRVHESLQ